MNGREYMETIRRVRRDIRLLTEQIERDSVIASGVQAICYDIDRVQTSPIGDRMSDIVANIVEATNTLYDRIQTLQALEHDARHLLLNLKEEHERALVLHYINDMPWAQVADVMGYGEKYIFVIRDNAFRELDDLLQDIA